VTELLPKPWTVEDFLAWERRQPERYEFVGGVIRMMVGGSNAHTIIKRNVFAALHSRSRGSRCRALAEGSKVVTATATMYPDAIVVCGPIDLAEDQVRAPAVVVEVLSRSTEDHDRGAKWVDYRDLEALRHYVLVAQDVRRVEVYSREAKRWSLQVLAPPRGDRPARDRCRADLGRDLRGQRRLIWPASIGVGIWPTFADDKDRALRFAGAGLPQGDKTWRSASASSAPA
jgi:Uma2 family endonuclease